MINQYSLDTEVDTELTQEKKNVEEETANSQEQLFKRPMSWLPRLKIFRNNLQEPQFDAAARGELMHYCIEGLNPELEPAFAAECAFNFGVQRTLVSNENIIQARPEIIKALTWLAALPQAAIWFRQGISEQLICDNQGHNYRADMVVYEPNLCTVLEFKSGSMYSGAQANSLNNPLDKPLGAPQACPQAWPSHLSQIKTYLKLLEQAQPLPVKGLLIYLDQQQIIAVNPE